MKNRSSLQQLLHNLDKKKAKSTSSQSVLSPNYNQLKQSMCKNYRHPWKSSGVASMISQVRRLSGKDLDNWEILRINMSKRSYQHAKGLKIPAVSRQFSRLQNKDKNGHIPYLYQSDIPKIERLKNKLNNKNFKVVNTAQRAYFGFLNKKNKQIVQQSRQGEEIISFI